MPFADGNTTAERNRRLHARLFEAMHQSRQRQATSILSAHASLLAGQEPAEPPRATQPAQSSREARPRRSGALLGTLAVLLILAHAICAAMIVDRALAHAPDAIAINSSD